MQSRLAERYDIIGDIHGHATQLKNLLQRLGYTKNSQGVYQSTASIAIFVGDFIDRGNEQKAVINIVKPMVESGAALAVMGNHEFNAIAYHSKSDKTGDPLRSHSKNHTKQHQAFLDEYSEQQDIDEVINWFKTLPLFIELDHIRVIHACWNDDAIAVIKPELDESNCLNDRFLEQATTEGTIQFNAVEKLLKGIELSLPINFSFKDSYGQKRHNIRIKWWQTKGNTYQNIAIVPESDLLKMPIEQAPIGTLGEFQYEITSKPVFFGHYWFTGKPKVQQSNVCCLDYSVANEGPLTAYRWCADQQRLRNDAFVQEVG